MDLPGSIINLIWIMAGVSDPPCTSTRRGRVLRRERAVLYCVSVVCLGYGVFIFCRDIPLFGEKWVKCENYLAAHSSWSCVLRVYYL
jgi:hypothetical protein